jgi:mannose-6-phosphate isomerase
MDITAPIIFEPLFMERVWGGRQLESIYHKALPPGTRIGESWEVVDREEAQSVVHTGPLKGSTLHDLWTDHREAVFGKVAAAPRFPLLLKILDAQERLSVQVHPPAAVAAELHGEPKTEMWYVADTHLDSDIFAGLQPGVTREDFEQALDKGDVADKLHRIEVKPGDAIFIPSGRVHAIGAGNLIVEVQQNSDTTYRVFDWNRIGLDGKARQLHIQESLVSIDFEDVEPKLQTPKGELIVSCDYFRIDKWKLDGPREATLAGQFAIFTCLEGEVECSGSHFHPGDFFLVSATQADRSLKAAAGTKASVLRTTIPA